MKRILMFFAAVCMLTLGAVSFTSCSDSDNDVTSIYSVSISEFSITAGTLSPKCLSQVESILKTAVQSVTSSQFSYKGNPTDGDNLVKNACKAKEAELNALDKSDFKGSVTYAVTRFVLSPDNNKSVAVYEYTIEGTKRSSTIFN